VGHLVEGLPGDEHGHDHGLAAARGHFRGDAEQAGVGVLVGLANLVLDPVVAVLPSDLSDIDERLERLDLAENSRLSRLGSCQC
jgi:hypothetical protein